jgi:hypothetical protein
MGKIANEELLQKLTDKFPGQVTKPAPIMACLLLKPVKTGHDCA